MTVTDKIIPNIVGVDIGCGMLTVKLKRINLPELDSFIRQSIPYGILLSVLGDEMILLSFYRTMIADLISPMYHIAVTERK